MSASSSSAPAGSSGQPASSESSSASGSDLYAVPDGYRAAVFISGPLPDEIANGGFYTFGLGDGKLGIEIDDDAFAKLVAAGKYVVVYNDEAPSDAPPLIVYSRD